MARNVMLRQQQNEYVSNLPTSFAFAFLKRTGTDNLQPRTVHPHRLPYTRRAALCFQSKLLSLSYPSFSPRYPPSSISKPNTRTLLYS